MASVPPPGEPPVVKDNSKQAFVNNDLISRGIYRSNPLGTTTFVGLRALDPLLQYGLLGPSEWGASLLRGLGLSAIPLLDHALTSSPDISLSLGGLPLPRLLVLLMAAGSSAKQVFWLLRTSREELTPAAAVSVSVYNTVVNTVASLLLLIPSTSASPSTRSISLPVPLLGGTLSLPLPMAVGTALYVVGLGLETVSEIGRKKFKDVPENEGQICNRGLWGRARHINYGGYTLWRTGYALAAGGWTAAAVVAGWHLWTFAYRSIGLMEEYMTARYGGKWEEYKRQVPYKLFPGIY